MREGAAEGARASADTRSLTRSAGGKSASIMSVEDIFKTRILPAGEGDVNWLGRVFVKDNQIVKVKFTGQELDVLSGCDFSDADIQVRRRREIGS